MNRCTDPKITPLEWLNRETERLGYYGTKNFVLICDREFLRDVANASNLKQIDLISTMCGDVHIAYTASTMRAPQLYAVDPEYASEYHPIYSEAIAERVARDD